MSREPRAGLDGLVGRPTIFRYAGSHRPDADPAGRRATRSRVARRRLHHAVGEDAVEPAYGTEESEWPGEFPFTRGLYPTGYRGRTWTIRQFAGFGNAEQTNERYKMILSRGGGGLSVAFDMPTLMGRDSDDPRALGEVGHCGVAIDSAADMERLFDGHRPRRRHHLDDDQRPRRPGVLHDDRRRRAPGRRHRQAQRHAADRHLQGVHRPEGVAVPARAAPAADRRPDGVLRREIPAYKPLSVSGYHIREAGSTAAQELAFTLADGFGYVELGLSRGLDVDVFAPGLSFFFDAHVDFFEEIAKFRAARRIWARWLRDVYGAKTEKAQWLRFHTQTAGVSLTAQQPYNNVVRTGIEALAAVLGGTNSLHTNALDETLALPSEQAAEIALRTQQVIMEETGVVNVADPLGGSWYVEALTDKIEAEANAIFDKILAMGGSTLTHADTEASLAATRSGGTPMTKGILPRHRGRLVHVRDRRGRLPVPGRPGEGREEDRRRQLPHRLRHPRPGDPAGLPRGRGRAGPRARRAPAGRDDAAVEAAIARMVEVVAHRREHDRGDARGRRAEATWARSATRCAPSGASTASRPGSESAARRSHRTRP